MNTSQIEAIAQADAYTNNAALPTYSDAVSALRYLSQQAALSDLPASNGARLEAERILRAING